MCDESTSAFRLFCFLVPFTTLKGPLFGWDPGPNARPSDMPRRLSAVSLAGPAHHFAYRCFLKESCQLGTTLLSLFIVVIAQRLGLLLRDDFCNLCSFPENVSWPSLVPLLKSQEQCKGGAMPAPCPSHLSAAPAQTFVPSTYRELVFGYIQHLIFLPPCHENGLRTACLLVFPALHIS